MKINEIVEAQPAKISQVQQGKKVVVDKGDGTEIHVDTKKNPSAIQKDPKTGQVKVNTSNKPGQKNNPATMIKPGDKVEFDDET